MLICERDRYLLADHKLSVEEIRAEAVYLRGVCEQDGPAILTDSCFWPIDEDVRTTGLSTTPHLHWKQTLSGALVDGLARLDGSAESALLATGTRFHEQYPDRSKVSIGHSSPLQVLFRAPVALP